MVNRFCIGADVTEAGDVPYLRILHGIYPGGYDRAGSTAYSYIVWNGGWEVFRQDAMLN